MASNIQGLQRSRRNRKATGLHRRDFNTIYAQLPHIRRDHTVHTLQRPGKLVFHAVTGDYEARPLAILPYRILGLMNSIAVASTRLMTYLSPSILNTRGALYWTLQRTALGRWCVGRFWDFLASLSNSHAGYSDGDHVEMLRPEIDRQR